MRPPAVIVHGPGHVRLALAPGGPVTLLSAPGAGCYGGARWWRRMIDGALDGAPMPDILDCGDQPGYAVEALRQGCQRVVLDPACRAFPDIAERADDLGAVLLAAAPAALDLGAKAGAHRLARWLDGAWPLR